MNTLVLIVSLVLVVSLVQARESSPEDQKQAYSKYFKEKRVQQQAAVKHLLELKDSKKQADMLKPVISKLFEVMHTSIEKLAKVQTKDRDPEDLKTDQEIANDVSVLLENTAFAADLVLHFPKVFHKMYAKNKQWKLVLESSITISIKSNMLDAETQEAIHLMSQELNIIPRSANYRNPYKPELKQFEEPAEEKVAKKAKKEKRPRGPGLSGGAKYDL